MFLRLNQNSQAWRYWNEICRGRRSTSKLSPTVILLLAYLDHKGEAYQVEIARECGLNQGNLSGRHLPNLMDMGFIGYRELDRRHKGEPVKVWKVYEPARVLLRLIREYDGGCVLKSVCDTGPYFVENGVKYVPPTIPSCSG